MKLVQTNRFIEENSMTKRKLLFIGLIIILSGVAVSAQQLAPGNNNGQPNRQNKLAEELGLSTDQVGEIQAIRRRTAQSLRQARQNFQQAKKELDEAIYADSVDEQDLRLKLKRVSEAQAEITRTQALREYAVRKVLQPKQLKRFRELRKNFANRNGNKRRLNQNQRKRIQNRRNQRRNQRNQQPTNRKP